MTARASRSFGNVIARYRAAIQSIQDNSKDFKHLSAELKAFAKAVDQLVAADAAQEKAKVTLAQASDALQTVASKAEPAFASLKRSWQAKYGPTTPKGRSFDAPGQGKAAKRGAKKAKGPAGSGGAGT